MSDSFASTSVEFRGDFTRLEHDLKKSEGDALGAGSRMGEKYGDGVAKGTAQSMASIRQEIARALGGGGGLMPSSALAGFTGDSLGAVAGLGLLKAAFSGVQTAMGDAADFNYYRRQLQGISGDAKTAESALNKLMNLAGKTNFDTDQVAGLGLTMADRYNDVGRGASATGSILDAAASFGVENGTFNRFQEEIQMISSRPNEMIPLDTLNAFQNTGHSFKSQVAKTLGVNVDQAQMRVRGMTGNQFLDLLQQVGHNNEGAAAQAGLSDPRNIGKNIRDDLKQALVPTGQIINDALRPAYEKAYDLAGAFKQLNQETGGQAGLIGVVGLATLGVKLMIPPLRSAYEGAGKLGGILRGLTAAINETATAAERATVAELAEGRAKMSIGPRAMSGENAAMWNPASGKYEVPTAGLGPAETAVGGARIVQLAKGGEGWGASSSIKVVGQPVGMGVEALEGAGKIGIGARSLLALRSLGGKGMSLGKGIGAAGKALGPTLIPMAAEYGGEVLADYGREHKNPLLTHLGRDLQAAGSWGIWGGVAGSVIPGVGTAAGAGIAAVIGIGREEYLQYRERQQGIGPSMPDGKTADKSSGDRTAERTANATEKTAVAVQQMASKGIGGGPRSEWGATQATREWAVMQLQLGLRAGVG